MSVHSRLQHSDVTAFLSALVNFCVFVLCVLYFVTVYHLPRHEVGVAGNILMSGTVHGIAPVRGIAPVHGIAPVRGIAPVHGICLSENFKLHG